MTPHERTTIVQEEFTRIADDREGGYFPPETALSHLEEYSIALIETVAIAIWGTLIAFIAAIPMSMFAAKNTLELMVQGDGIHQRIVRWFGQFVARRMLDFCRGFNEFVMALIFVAVIGLGPYAGVLALAIHTFGILGKVFSEAIEQIEPGQVEAVTASGAGPAQIMAFSVIPQVMPLIVSYTLLRFESNVRSATILGFVGAGGIGFLMFDKINGYLYREVCTMMLMVIISVTLIDYLCGILRRRFV
jgi:phosphonate transport system permease protein